MTTITEQAQEFRRISNVSDEVFALYEEWYSLLSHWNKRINLVSQHTISNYWVRHALDSHQLFEFMPKGHISVLDMGSGGGFPGLSLAISLRQIKDAQIVLVEANGKKCNFLRAVIRALDLPAKVIQERVEKSDIIRARATVLGINNFNVITARAFAPLSELCAYSLPFWNDEMTAIFPKGENWESEVKAAQENWNFAHTNIQSQTNEAAKIILMTGLEKREDI